MLLTIDIGNTNITLGAFLEDKLRFTARMATDRRRTSDQYAAEMLALFQLNNVAPKSFSGSIISSVVPPLTAAMAQAVKTLTGVDAKILSSELETGLDILIDSPEQTGADLIAVSVAAKAKYPCPNVVCDLGTASTMTVLDEHGRFIGGAIYPGVRTSLDALVKDTSLLQLISFDAPEKVIGRNTIECMQSGVIFGAAALLDGMLLRIENELQQPVTAIATGGLSYSIIQHCQRDFNYCENLVLEGLRLIWEMNI